MIAQVGPITDQLPQEIVSNYEIGWKQSWDQAFVSVTGYFMDWEDMKAGTTVLFTSEIDGRPLVGSVFLPGNSEIKGIEFEGGWSPVDRLNLGATLGFINAEYTDFLAGNFNAPFNLPPAGSGVSYKADGMQLPRSPDFKGTVSATWMDQLTSDWDWYLRGDLIHNGKTYMSEPNLAYVDAYNMVNLRLGMVKDDNVSLELFCTNCLNERGWRTAARVPDLVNLFRGFPGGQGAVVVPLDEAEYGLGITFEF